VWCVCVERLNRRKTLRIHHIISHYIGYILLQGATGVPGGSVATEDTPPGPVKTYLLAVALDGNPLSGGRSWALQ